MKECSIVPCTQLHWHSRCYAQTVRKFPFHPKFDPLGVKTGLELAAGGIAALLLMRWLGM